MFGAYFICKLPIPACLTDYLKPLMTVSYFHVVVSMLHLVNPLKVLIF